MRLTRLVAAFALASCASVPAPSIPVTGDWGGTHVRLTLGPSGGALEYDCAAGTIGPVVPDAAGRFTAQGTHTPGTGGPEIAGQPRPVVPARYAGRVRGDRMTLSGRIDSGVALGPFTLRRGAEPIIFRCL